MLLRAFRDFRFYAPADEGAPGGAAAAEAAGGAKPAGAPDPAAAAGGKPSAGVVTSWRDALPDDLRGSPYLASHETPESVARELVNVQGLIGKKGAIIPDEKAPPEKWAEFFRAAGAPETADGYKFTLLEGDKADAPDVQKFHGAMKGLFHKANVTARQAAILNEGWNAIEAERRGGVAQATEEEKAARQAKTEEIVKTTTKGEFNKALDLADRTVRFFGGEEMLADLDANGGTAEQRAARILMFSKIGEALSGDLDFVNGSQGPATATGAAAELDAIYNAAAKDPEHAYTNTKHPEHGAMVKKVMALHRQATAGKS